jgi:hypothetical protein
MCHIVPVNRSEANLYISSYINCTLSKTTLRVSQATLGLLAILSGSIALEGCIESNLPSWTYPTSYFTVGFSLLGLATTLIFKPTVYTPITQRTPLLSSKEISSLDVSSLIHELCEMNTDGTSKPCTMERLKEIIEELEIKEALKALNSIPKHYLSKSNSMKLFSLPDTLYTPLQYWAARGNLPAVQFLVKHGAVDYPDARVEIDSGKMTSALYAAVMHGHSSVTSYLLLHGAQATIAFNNNLLFSFIPKLIFEFCQIDAFGFPITLSFFECLEQVLQHLSSHQPSSLALQLRIPISSGKGSFDWVETVESPSNERMQLTQLLAQFGAIRNNALSNDELQSQGNIGRGFTLQEISSFKH